MPCCRVYPDIVKCFWLGVRQRVGSHFRPVGARVSCYVKDFHPPLPAEMVRGLGLVPPDAGGVIDLGAKEPLGLQACVLLESIGLSHMNPQLR